ncbi:MAG TPA: hypothetical protein VFI40_11525 [Nocardioides sp.]|jgi:hypothetical protein|nr:hypothetical protein [Marmoricola sp.]HET7071447.1 hypothetical protein [Nocardioides sp.]
MVAIITILSAFPLGYLVRSRLAANTAYAVAYLWAFTFQTLYLILDVINDSTDPAFDQQKFPWAYGLVTLSIFLAGFGLVALGRLVRARRTARRSQPMGVAA